MRMRAAVTVSALALAAACAGGEGGGAPGPGGLDGPDVPLAWTAEPVFTLGGIDAPAWAAFGEVRGVAFDGSGNLYVLDGQARQVTVVDPQGGFVRTIGEPGEGPGELIYPSALAVHPDGRLAVLDPGHRGFVVYGPDGAYLHDAPVDPDVGFPSGPLAVHPDGWIVGTGEGAPSAEAAVDPPPATRPVILYDDGPDGSHRRIHEAWRPPLPETRELAPEETGGIRVRLPPLVAFHPGLLVHPLVDGRLAVVDSFAWRIELVDPDGRVTGTLERPIEPVPVTEALRERERALRLERLVADAPRMVVNRADGRSAGVDAGVVQRLQTARIDAMGFHAQVPVVERLAVDAEGRIRVQRSSAEPGRPGPTDVVTPDGRYLGTLAADGPRIPAAFGPGGLAAYLEADALGVPVVRVMRIGIGG